MRLVTDKQASASYHGGVFIDEDEIVIKTIEDMKMCYVPRHDKEVFELFMDKCEEFGLSWSDYSGGEPRDIKLGEVVVFNGSTNKLLTHASEAYAAVKGYKRLTLSDLKPRTRTEYEKVAESPRELFQAMLNGEEFYLFKEELLNFDGNQFWRHTEDGKSRITFIEDENEIYRKVEKEIDWRDEVNKAFPAIDFRDLDSHNSHDLGCWQPESFLELCRVALRANGELD